MTISTFRKITVGLLAGLALLAVQPLAAQDPSGDQVIAVVEGEKITRQDFTIAYSSLPPRVRQQGMETLYPHVLELLIQQVLIVKKGREANLAADPEVQARMKAFEDRTIHNVYLNREIEKRLTNELLLAEYDKFVAANPPQEEVRARHILVNSEAEAREIINLVGQGQPFAELAKTRSQGPSSAQGGDLGFFARGKMVKEFEDIAFALEPNTYSIDPVKTQYGWHVILVEEKRVIDPPSFDQIKPRLAQAVGQAMAGDVKQSIVDNAKIERFDLDGKSINPPAQVLPELLGVQ
ncbi:peptidylprolyl isomerase [Aestuariispira insulae]|uniref:Parvulin-like PPIase n=1 Tax=Aestuariispira insulae TaxID=1461337 RepID=A0A3D9HF96_9PROT|nr:peptidylprolyl isomerase [Aestuariispira insulae]RED47646.1 peptidyl-prolyl cis-trans isomerase C [Aestuariispira insulae]